MKTIVVYSQPGCAPCAEVKSWLERQGYPFTERNIRLDPVALQDLIAGGYQSTPVTMVDGQPVVGFQPAELERLIKA
jgi:glutaredoxin